MTAETLGTRTYGMGWVVDVHVVGSAWPLHSVVDFRCDKCGQKMSCGIQLCLEKESLPDDQITVCWVCRNKLLEQFKEDEPYGHY